MILFLNDLKFPSLTNCAYDVLTQLLQSLNLCLKLPNASILITYPRLHIDHSALYIYDLLLQLHVPFVQSLDL